MKRILLLLAVLLVASPVLALEKTDVVIGAGAMYHDVEADSDELPLNDTQPFIFTGYQNVGLSWSRHEDVHQLMGTVDLAIMDAPLNAGSLVVTLGGGANWSDSFGDGWEAAILLGGALSSKIGDVPVKFGYMRHTSGANMNEKNLWYVGAYFSPGD